MEQEANPVSLVEAEAMLWLCYAAIGAALVCVALSLWKAMRIHSGSTGIEHGVPARRIALGTAAITAVCLVLTWACTDGIAAMMLDSCLIMAAIAIGVMAWSGAVNGWRTNKAQRPSSPASANS